MGRNRDTQLLRAYHDRTNHTEARLRAEPHALDFQNQPIPFKVYPDLDPIPLPPEIGTYDAPALAALMAPLTAAEVECIPTLHDLARVLYLGAGVLRRKRHPGGEIYFRSYANTGALYHIDLYVVCGKLDGLAAGVYHFSPHDFALRRLREGDHRATLADASGAEPRVAHAPAILVSASTYWRNAWKYRARTYRHCFWDSGTMHANLLGAAKTAGLTPAAVLGFADAPVEHLLGLDPQREGALTLVPLGHTDAPAPPAPDAPAIDYATLPLSGHEIDYPPIREAHAASTFDDGAEAAAWRAGTTPTWPVPPAHGRLLPLHTPAGTVRESNLLERVIVRRGSTREFDPEFAMSFSQLSTVLDTATAPVRTDFLDAPRDSLLDIYVIANNVTDLPRGAYYLRRDERALELLEEGDFRAQAGRLGLFQEIPAYCSANVYTLTDLDAVLARYGNRGYRAAQFEGGLRGGRMYLAAYAQQLGASGLTFLDDEVVDFFSPHAAGKAVMFLCALGRSIKKRGA